MHVRGHYFSLSPGIINDYLCGERLITTDRVLSLKSIVKEITRNVHDDCPSKDPLVASNLSVKYEIMFNIGVINWDASSHISYITLSLCCIRYALGKLLILVIISLSKWLNMLNLAVKILIRLPYLISDILFGQKIYF